MNYWIITDTHLGHDKMFKEGLRPQGFEETILKNLMNVVQRDDIVIHLGDICFYREEYWNDRLNLACRCRQWLLLGNHDKKSKGWYLSHGWDFVAEEIILNIYGKMVALSHRPIVGRDNFDLNIHGHHHNTLHHPEDETTEKHRLVFMEHDYRPVSLRKLIERKGA